MEEKEINGYILEQAKIEVDHTRSWPTKVMAFYVAINFGLVGSLIALKNLATSFTSPFWGKIILGLLILVLSIWVVFVLIKNHINYLTYRNIQVEFQKNHLQDSKEKYSLPVDWFKRNEICFSTRFWGWGFYLYIVIIITLLTEVALFII